MSETSEQNAERIAARGREALIARLRPAFQEAAAAHADVLDLTEEQLEGMIQRAADRADGLQWRRALAAVATEELGISLGEALSHPDVVKAHELVGAPSYEDSLAELTPPVARPAPTAQAGPSAQTAPAPEPAADAEPTAEGEPTADAEPAPDAEPAADTEPASAPAPEAPEALSIAASEPAPEAESEPQPDSEAAPQPDEHDESSPEDEEASLGSARPDAPLPGMEPPAEEHAGPDDTDEHAFDEADAHAAPIAALDQPTVEYEIDEYDDEDEYYEPEGLRVSVVHLGGIANLEPAEKNIELLMSDEGLDIIRGGSHILGRLEWDQVKALEVPLARGRRRMRKPGATHLVIRTARGDASFEVPEVTVEELRQHLAPVIDEHLHGI